jgi:hypothetical protein
MGNFLDYISDQTGLLIDRGGGQLSFIHLSFQEYLAAWVFTCEPREHDNLKFFPRYLGRQAWEEVLLLRLYRRRTSATLHVSRPGGEKRIFLREGVPVMAESNLPSESLGVMLMDAGRITRDDYARVVEAVRTRRCKEGAALLGLELVAPRELYEALKQQVRRRLLDCLGWTRGSFALEAGAAPVEDAAAFRCDPIPLVQEAVAIHWSPATLRTQLGAKLDAYAVATPRTEALVSRLFRDADVDAFVAGLGGDAPLAAQLDALRAPTALAAAWVLDALGALAYRDRPASDAARDGAGNPDRPDI